ncbi:MAG: type II toxin-antitoxin system RelE/ParE family toxin [Nitrospinales bacterium]
MAKDSPQTATAFIQKLEEKFAPLLSNPNLGPSREHLAPGLRAHFYRNYVIYYESTDMEIIIIRVVHSSRDQATLLDGEE